MKHNPALDGLRALAVLLVIVFHAAAALPVPPAGDALVLYRIAKVGWIGVDLFFVLSGYLITSILLNSKTDSLKRYCKVFYARRALRIFPLYFVFVPAVLILLSLFGPLRPTWNDWLIHLTYGQNSIGLYLPSHVGPFLGHTWSLAVEEWFYLLWPFFVFFASPPKLRRIALFGLVGILTLRLARADPGLGLPIYSSFFTNFDALMVGALLALSGPSRASRIAWIAAGAIAFGAFVGARLVTSDAYKLVAFNNGPGSTLIAFGAAALITICIGGANRIARIFALRPLAGMGRISYGIYLFHLPILTALAVLILPVTAGLNYFARLGLLLLPVAVISIGLAALSYAGFEKRVLGLKSRFTYAEPAPKPQDTLPETAPIHQDGKTPPAISPPSQPHPSQEAREPAWGR